MTLVDTIPADDAALLAKTEPKATGNKKIVAGAAMASFVLGMALTAVTHRAPANLSAVDWQCRSSGGGSTGYSKWCPAQNECVRPWQYPAHAFNMYCVEKSQKRCRADEDWNWHGCDSKHRCKPDGGGDADTGSCWWSQDGKTHGCDVDLRCDKKTSSCVPKNKPSSKGQCDRRCESNWDCNKDQKDGKWSKGEPWCGTCGDDGFCKPHFQDCSHDWDCDRSKSRCGPEGFCVGK